MTPKIKPYPLGWIVAAGLAAAVGFALLSLFFLYMQVQGAHHRLTGAVVTVSSESVRVANAHGEITVLVIPDDAELRGVSSPQALTVGQHIMTRGSILDDGTFKVDRLRTLKRGPPNDG